MSEDSEQINNEETETSTEEVSESSGQEDTKDDKETGAEDSQEDTDEEEDKKDVPFNEHPRWKKMESKLADSESLTEELADTVKQLQDAIGKLSSASTKEETDEIMAELEKMDEERPASYKELFSKFEKLHEKKAQKAKEAEAEATKSAEEATTKQLTDQLDELVEMGKLKEDEVADFTRWTAEQIVKPNAPRSIYGNFHAAIYEWRNHLNTIDKDKPDDKSRRGIGASGGTGSEQVKVTAGDMKNISMAEALRRGRR